jgi:hypothetical protein
MGLTPQAATAGTASCMAASGMQLDHVGGIAAADVLRWPAEKARMTFHPLSQGRDDQKAVSTHSPSIFPCSQSTNTQSTPVRARVLDTFAPGSICQQPIEAAFPSFNAVCSRLAACIVDGMASDLAGRAVAGSCLRTEARVSCERGQASSFCIKTWATQGGKLLFASPIPGGPFCMSDLTSGGGGVGACCPARWVAWCQSARDSPHSTFAAERARISDPLPSEPDGQRPSFGRARG